MKSQLPKLPLQFYTDNDQKNESMTQVYARDDCRIVIQISIPRLIKNL